MIAPIINQNQIARNKLADKINEIIAELNPILEERGHLIKVYEEVSKNMFDKPTHSDTDIDPHFLKRCGGLPNPVTDDPFGPHLNIYEQSMRMEKEFAEDEIERLQKELDHTKKQLEIAVDALNTVTATPLNSRVIHDVANKALEQITALKRTELENLELLVNNVFK